MDPFNHVSARVVVLALLACLGCTDDDAATPRAMRGEAFDEAVAEICERHGKDLESLLDEFVEVFEEVPEEQLDAAVEADRRRLVELKRDLIAELRRIEPSSKADAWHSAVDRYEAAIDRVAAGPRVDVRARDVGAATSALIDDFGMKDCF